MPNEVTLTPKSPSKSSVKSKPSNMSLKSDSGSMVSAENEITTTEVHQILHTMFEHKLYAPIFCMKDKSQPDGVTASTQTPKKSPSKSSLKSKSSKASLKSISGSTVSVKNETATEEVMQ